MRDLSGTARYPSLVGRHVPRTCLAARPRGGRTRGRDGRPLGGLPGPAGALYRSMPPALRRLRGCSSRRRRRAAGRGQAQARRELPAQPVRACREGQARVLGAPSRARACARGGGLAVPLPFPRRAVPGIQRPSPGQLAPAQRLHRRQLLGALQRGRCSGRGPCDAQERPQDQRAGAGRCGPQARLGQGQAGSQGPLHEQGDHRPDPGAGQGGGRAGRAAGGARGRARGPARPR